MQKSLIILFCIISQIGYAQIKGDNSIITQTYQLEELQFLDIGLYANVTVNCNASDAAITITTDENILDLIDFEVLSGKMKLVQKEWIKPSKPIEITIDAPSLTQIQQSVHRTTKVINIDQNSIAATAILGAIKLEGKVNHLNANAESGDIDAKSLIVENVQINIWDDGHVYLDKAESITGIMKKESKLTYEGPIPNVKVKTKNEATIIDTKKEVIANNEDAKWINVKIKNNSLKRLQCYVKGPKPDGKTFSYGFPINPGQVKKERWTVGTKVYKMSKLGLRKTLLELDQEDENQVVTLFE